MITFRCPNGHKINSREELVGKSGKCPKCQSPFTVPPASSSSDPLVGSPEARIVGHGDPFELAQEERHAAEIAAAKNALIEAAIAPLHADAGDELVVFLCPNGHKLNSSPRMVGRPGQCPHCQARFLVPDPADLPEDDAGGEGDAARPPLRVGALEAGQIAVHNGQMGDAAISGALPDGALSAGAVPGGASLALFARLWSYKTQQGATVELHLRDHKVIVPEFYSPRYSTPTHGLFGDLESNGSYRLLAIAWSAIERIAVRGATTLPPDIFQSG